jgi:hypothetical protein
LTFLFSTARNVPHVALHFAAKFWSRKKDTEVLVSCHERPAEHGGPKLLGCVVSFCWYQNFSLTMVIWRNPHTNTCIFAILNRFDMLCDGGVCADTMILHHFDEICFCQQRWRLFMFVSASHK